MNRIPLLSTHYIRNRGSCPDLWTEICTAMPEDRTGSSFHTDLTTDTLNGVDGQEDHKVVPSLVGLAFGGLLGFDVLRLGHNFAKLRRIVGGWTLARQLRFANPVNRVCRAVNYACIWYPKRVQCLQRSVVTTCLLRSCGVPAKMVIGIQQLPFRAHAWTEVDGRAINERRDVQRIYQVLERC